MCGKDREVSGDVPVSIRALHQPSQAQHLSLLAQAADEGDEPAHDRRLSRQPLPAHESGVSHRTLPPALPGGLRGSGGVTESHRGAWGGKKKGAKLIMNLFSQRYTRSIWFPHPHAMPNRDMYFYFTPSVPHQLCLGYVLSCRPPHLSTPQSPAIQIPPTDGQKASMHQPTSRTNIPPILRRSLF